MLLLLTGVGGRTGAVAAAATGASADGGQPISEAQRLYCQSCAASCGGQSAAEVPAGGGQRNSPAAEEAANRSEPLDEGRHEGREGTTRIKLECRCRTVFDLAEKSFICKNMSRAQARVFEAPPRADSNDANTNSRRQQTKQRQQLEAWAAARSQSAALPKLQN